MTIKKGLAELEVRLVLNKHKTPVHPSVPFLSDLSDGDDKNGLKLKNNKEIISSLLLVYLHPDHLIFCQQRVRMTKVITVVTMRMQSDMQRHKNTLIAMPTTITTCTI